MVHHTIEPSLPINLCLSFVVEAMNLEFYFLKDFFTCTFPVLSCMELLLLNSQGILIYSYVFCCINFRGRKRFVSEGDGGTVKDPEY